MVVLALSVTLALAVAVGAALDVGALPSVLLSSGSSATTPARADVPPAADVSSVAAKDGVAGCGVEGIASGDSLASGTAAGELVTDTSAVACALALAVGVGVGEVTSSPRTSSTTQRDGNALTTCGAVEDSVVGLAVAGDADSNMPATSAMLVTDAVYAAAP